MKIRDLKLHEHIHAGKWVADWSHTGDCDYRDRDAVIALHRPHLEVSLLDIVRPAIMEDLNYKQIMQGIDPGFLQQGERVKPTYQLQNDATWYHFGGVSYQGFSQNNMVFFVTPSTEFPERDKPPHYVNLIKFMHWDDIGGDPDLSPRDKAQLMLWTSPLQLHCTDPSFLYWGYEYILTTMNAAVAPIQIPPNKNNPGERGIVCKHLNRILHVIPFYINDIAKAITSVFGGKISKREIDAIRRRADIQKEVNKENQELPMESETPPPEINIDQIEQEPNYLMGAQQQNLITPQQPVSPIVRAELPEPRDETPTTTPNL